MALDGLLRPSIVGLNLIRLVSVPCYVLSFEATGLIIDGPNPMIIGIHEFHITVITENKDIFLIGAENNFHGFRA